MSLIVTGRLRNGWSDRYNHTRIARRRLVKEIRANLLLRWLFQHFPGMPLILLLRHPCAVVAARLRVDWSHYNLNVFLRQQELMADFLSPFRPELEKATSPFDIHLFHWCIETFIPLQQFTAGQVHLAFYENFCASPQEEIHRFYTFLGRQMDERILSFLEKPSSQTHRENHKLPSRAELASGWRQYLSGYQVERIQSVLRHFGLHNIYRSDGMPDLAATQALMNSKRP
jgi:hypothetical protein